MDASKPPRALIAVPNEGLRAAAARALRTTGFDVVAAGREAVQLLVSTRWCEPPALLVFDLHPPRYDALRTLAAIHTLQPGLPIIALIPAGCEYLRDRATMLGASAVLDKPLSATALASTALAATADRGAVRVAGRIPARP